MNTNTYKNRDGASEQASFGRAVGDILAESRKRRVVIWNRAGQPVLDISVLLALILSVGAPAFPALVALGVLVEAVRVSVEERNEKSS